MLRPVLVAFIATIFSLVSADLAAQTQTPKPAGNVNVNNPANHVLPGSPPSSPVPSSPPVAPKKAKPLEIAVFPLEAKFVDKALADMITDTLHAQVARIPNSRVISSKELDTMMGYEQKKQLSGCSDMSCMVAIGGAMGVDKLLVGSVGKIGNSYMFNVKLLNIYEGKVEGIFDKRLKGSTDEELLDAIPEALIILFPQYAGLWANAAVSAAEEKRKQQAVVPAPLPPSAAGTPELQRNATVQPAATPVYKIVPWVLVGIGAGSLVGGGVCTGLVYSEYDDYKNMPWNDPNKADKKSSLETKMTASYALYGAGAALVAGGLIWYFVANAKSKTVGSAEVGAPRLKRGAPGEIATKEFTLVFTPLVFDGVGGNLSVNW